ncbi:hypothetical protein TFKS16_0415 [Tannerella forsythia KS16]|uniref:Uncharacterized protein n=1 Tax=Tannerella forsythia (strain ATCC 43037 / JCM 10827 / CCUG 21028 A / KCTC 5666 / FDC 338) TaxID=203275 RepID=G8ULE6_TANFA|nr:hypothetical protein BFO_0526 [Tannerella forsythia 92A2]BAR50729.1 hypothetical protein TFKS16_0415 [Tannerella forsythia KS16]
MIRAAAFGTNNTYLAAILLEFLLTAFFIRKLGYKIDERHIT